MKMKKAMKLVSLVLAVVMLLGCLTACGSKSATTDATASNGTASNDTAAASDGGEIVIALISNTTGDYAQYGQPVRDGAMLYINQLNANGGINGKQVKVLEYDDKGDGVEAVNAYNLACDNGITAVFGATLTGTTIALADATYEDNMPQVTASATATGVTVIDPADPESEIRPNVFRACFIDPYQGQLMASYASKKLNAKTAAILFDNGDPYSSGIADAFEAAAKALGMTITNKEGYASKSTDFNSQLTKIKAGNPDVLLLPVYYNDVVLIAKQAKDQGLTATLLGADGWDGVAAQLDAASADVVKNAYFCSQYSASSSDPALQNFLKTYKEKYNEEPNMFAVLGYDAMQIMAAAIEKAGTTDSAAVIKALRETNYKGLTGTTTFDDKRNPVREAIITSFDGLNYKVVESYSMS